ncbi:MAG: glycoside hydrolase family 125 protein [Bacteroidetes bacterium]|nr:glycoside hydrolase family 125 protein [Bacteroidota bacterium]
MKLKHFLCTGLIGIGLFATPFINESQAVNLPPKKSLSVAKDKTAVYTSQRPHINDRLFKSDAIEKKIQEICRLLKNPKLAWMFANCYPNTLDTTVHYRVIDGQDDTFVYTGDIHAMWLRDSGAQVYPYVQLANQDEKLRKMLAGVIHRHTKCILLDPFANAFNDGAVGSEWEKDLTDMIPELHERKWEIDSLCYPIRLAYEYWKVTGDTSVFTDDWVRAMALVVATFKDQQRKENLGSYTFQRETFRVVDTMLNHGYGAPVNPVGLIASAFRPSDDSCTYLFLVPSNFFAVTSLRKVAEILTTVKNNPGLAKECTDLALEVETALREYAVCDHPEFGKIYAYEIDGFGSRALMDDSNVPSLLAMAYLGDVDINDPIYQNTRRFVWSKSNPYFFSGKVGEGIGGPHIGLDMVWPMSIMMKVFTSQDDAEIKTYVKMLMDTDAGTGFMHESFHKDDATNFTRPWFAWQNTLFGELIITLIDNGKLGLLNSIE